MRMISLWMDDARVGCGLRCYLEVERGTRYSHLLYVPMLAHLEVPIEEVDRQMVLRIGEEYSVRRGLIKAIREKVKLFNEYDKRYSAVFVKAALAGLRELRVEEAAEADAAMAEVVDGEPAIVASDDPAATVVAIGGEKAHPEKPSRVARAPKTPIEALLTQAAALGYVEQAAPNAGVRAMRVKNFLRNHGGEGARA